MNFRLVTAAFALAAPALLAQAPRSAPKSSAAQDRIVHVNQIQVIGTHNSYNMGFAPTEYRYLMEHYPRTVHSVEYHHQTLFNQLSAGVRQLELDLVRDDKGGRFSHPKIVGLAKAEGLPADPDFDPTHEFDKPGFKIIHLGDINLRSACGLFVTCLQQIRSWSRTHPNHLPIFLLIEDKQGSLSSFPGATRAEPWTAATWDSLDKEILSVFPRKELITPDDVRGKHATLNEAVQSTGWPTLAHARGKVIFLLYNRKSGPAYIAGHPMMKGRVLFINSTAGAPEAGFVEDDKGTAASINNLVKQNYLVRTRVDFNTEEGRTNNTTRRDLLIHDTGAQMISTDFPVSEPAPWTGYTVGFPDGLVAHCSVVNAPKGCRSDWLEPGVKTLPASPPHHP